MNRRVFLHLLSTGALGAIVAPELDLERLLWIPGQKTFFLPPERRLVDLSSPLSAITREALDYFRTALARPSDHDGSRISPHLDRTLAYAPNRVQWREVTLSLLDREGQNDRLINEHIVPSMYALAAKYRGDRLATFGVLPCVPHLCQQDWYETTVITNPGKGLSLRGRRWYDSLNQKTMLAFDVIGGA